MKVTLHVHWLNEFHKRQKQVVTFEVPEGEEPDEYADGVARGFITAGFHGSSKDQEFWIPGHRVLAVYSRERRQDGYRS